MSNLTPRGTIKGIIRSGGGGGVTDYDQLTGRPQINTNLLTGDKGGHDYGLMNLDDIEITKIVDMTYGTNYDLTILGDNVHITDQEFKPAGVSDNGTKGLVPRPSAGDTGKILSNEGWIDPPESYTPPDYSLTAHKTGRKWIDGKYIWEQTFVGTLTSSTQDYTIGTLDGTIETVITQRGAVYYQPYNQFLSIPYTSFASQTTVTMFNRAGAQHVQTTNLSGYTTVIVVVEYTRTDE